MAPLRGKRDVQRARSPAVRVAADKAPSCQAVPLVQSARGGKHDPSIRWRGQGCSYLFFQSHSLWRSNVGTRRRPICSFWFWTCFSVFCRKWRGLFGILKDTCGKRIDCMILREAAVRPVICLISQRAVWCLANSTVPIWIQRMNSHWVHY